MRGPLCSSWWSLALCAPLLACAGAPTRPAPPQPTATGCASNTQAVDEARFIAVGGIEQWVTLQGASCANPIILFVHGGPGNPNTPTADPVYGAWEKEFTLVQWDQRGSGRTFGRNPRDPDEIDPEFTVERLAQDGVELAAFVARHLGQEKVILFGGSWGSVVATHMAKLRPELFHAYVITGPLVSAREDTEAGYQKVLALARAAGDARSLSVLESLGPPPWTNPRSPGAFRRVNRAYEAKVSDPTPREWFVKAPQYATPEAEAEYTKGEDYSWLQYVGLRGDGLASRIDLRALGTRFEMPMYFVQGAEDLVTVPEVSRRYYDSIEAPEKDWVLLPRTGHDPNPAMLAAQYEILKQKVAPRVE